MEMDANTAKSPSLQSPQPQQLAAERKFVDRSLNHQQQQQQLRLAQQQQQQQLQNSAALEVDVVRAGDHVEDVRIETADISNKFKFFETYRPAAGEKKQFRITPPRDGVVKLPSPERDDDDEDYDDDDDYEDDDVDGNDDANRTLGDADAALAAENGSNNGNNNGRRRGLRQNRRDKQRDPIMLQNSSTTTKMLSMFRQMEEERNEQQHFDGDYLRHRYVSLAYPVPFIFRRHEAAQVFHTAAGQQSSAFAHRQQRIGERLHRFGEPGR